MTAAARRHRQHELAIAAASVVHDVNNRLGAITAAAEAALGREAIDADTEADLRHIRLESNRAAAMLRRLLAVDAAAAAPLRRVALDPIVQDICGALRRLLSPPVRLELAFGCRDDCVQLDPDALHDALLNLTVNARDAMAEDGVLTLRTNLASPATPLPAVSQTIPPGRYAVIEVRDNGTGISPEAMRRLHEPFFTTKTPRQGCGLGLHSVQETMRRHGGFMTIASQPGRGTQVSLYLPVCDMPPRAGGGRLVLLVEDEPAVRRHEARLLTRNGWRVHETEDGETALRLLRRSATERPCLLVCDLALPGLDGPALIRAARQIVPGLPAIVVSGYAREGAPDGLDRVGFLRKPFRANELLDLADGLAAPSTGE